MSDNRPERVMLFDLYKGGHHAQYIEQIVRHWPDPDGPELLIAAQSGLVDQSPLLARLRSNPSDRIRIVELEETELHVDGVSDLIRNDRAHARRLRAAIDAHRPDHCVLMYFDHLQLSLALDLRLDTPTRLSGIYFRPSFHYASLGDRSASLAERLRSFRKRILLSAALRNPHFDLLFSLDPFAADAIRSWSPPARVIALPDGVNTTPMPATADRLRTLPGGGPDRKVALMFGVIDRRKGIHVVLEALTLLESHAQERVCLALFGPQVDRKSTADGLDLVRRSTAIHVIEDDRFIYQEEIPQIIESGDIILLTYVHHIGSSNVLVRAAAAGKPVLGPRYGLVGEYIRRNQLGLTVDTSDARQVAEGLVRLLDDPDRYFDSEKARRFAEQHAEQHFAETIMSALLR